MDQMRQWKEIKFMVYDLRGQEGDRGKLKGENGFPYQKPEMFQCQEALGSSESSGQSLRT